VLVALDEAYDWEGLASASQRDRRRKIENLKLTTATPNTSRQKKKMCPDEEPKTAA